jgi:hypothetical protein
MVANESQFWSSHQLRLEQVYYEIVTWRTDAGYRAEWICLKCRPSLANKLLISDSNDDAYEAARLEVGRHHRLFHSEPPLAPEPAIAPEPLKLLVAPH